MSVRPSLGHGEVEKDGQRVTAAFVNADDDLGKILILISSSFDSDICHLMSSILQLLQKC